MRAWVQLRVQEHVELQESVHVDARDVDDAAFELLHELVSNRNVLLLKRLMQLERQLNIEDEWARRV